jgi:hypothetical protein
MEFLEKITLKQATLYALIGVIAGFIVNLIQMFNYFTLFTLVNTLSSGALALFLYKLHSKQKGE